MRFGDGGNSDYIIFGNGLTANAAANQGEVLFYSDPTFPSDLSRFTNAGVLCTEDNSNGCVGNFSLPTTAVDTIGVRAGSDGEDVFNPFGFTGDDNDTSDGIAFSTSVVPEPSLLLLTGVLLFLVVGARRLNAI